MTQDLRDASASILSFKDLTFSFGLSVKCIVSPAIFSRMTSIKRSSTICWTSPVMYPWNDCFVKQVTRLHNQYIITSVVLSISCVHIESYTFDKLLPFGVLLVAKLGSVIVVKSIFNVLCNIIKLNSNCQLGARNTPVFYWQKTLPPSYQDPEHRRRGSTQKPPSGQRWLWKWFSFH